MSVSAMFPCMCCMSVHVCGSTWLCVLVCVIEGGMCVCVSVCACVCVCVGVLCVMGLSESLVKPAVIELFSAVRELFSDSRWLAG